MYSLIEKFYYPSNLDGDIDIHYINNGLKRSDRIEVGDTIIFNCRHKLSNDDYKRIHKPMCASIENKALYVLKPIEYDDKEGYPFVYYKVTQVYNDLNGILDMYDNELTQSILLIKSIGFTDAIEAGEVYTMLKDSVPNFDPDDEDDLGDDSDIDFIIHG